jgi:excisionase family DNA binding protein
MSDDLFLLVQKCAPYNFAPDLFGSEVQAKLDRILSCSEKDVPSFDWKNKVWFTRGEAASYLSISEKTIDRCRIKQDLPYYQVEGTSSFRFKRQDLDNLMN